MNNKDQAFQKHIPVFPLPEEILKMDKEETICQYCGVSYLIHSEIKKLEDRIKELENNLKDYEVLKIKEKEFKNINDNLNLRIHELEDDLSNRVQIISSLNNDIQSKDLDINRLKNKIYEKENENYSLVIKNESIWNKMLKYDSVVKETQIKLSAIKSDLKFIEITTSDQLKFLMNFASSLRIQIEKNIQKISKEFMVKLELENSLKNQLSSSSKQNELNIEKIDSYLVQINSLQKIRSELETKISIITNELDKNKELNMSIANFEKEKRMYYEENSKLKNEIEQLKIYSNNLVVEKSELIEKLNFIKNDSHSINSNHQNEINSKNEEIKRLKIEIEQVKIRFNDKENFVNELLTNNQKNMNEFNSLKLEVNRLNDLITELNNERNAITIAHQCQIRQLKDSFKDKLKNNDDWKNNLTNELKIEREKHSDEIKKLEIELKENFKIELEIHQQKYNEMYLKYQKLNKESELNSKNFINKLELDNQKLTNELKNLHDEKLKNEKIFKQDLESLREIIKDLHERLEINHKETDDTNNQKLNQTLVEKDNLINQLENKLKYLESNLKKSNEEIKVLQELVHNECMERQELLEKLDETKDELLILKKNAYASNQLIPLNGSNKKSNFTKFKNSHDLIDLNLSKNLNEIENQKMIVNRNILLESRRNSTPSLINRSGSEKSQPDSTSKIIEYENPKRFNLGNSQTLTMLDTNGNMPTEPIQLFKKFNQLPKPKNGNQKSSPLHDSSIENKKRISILLARKS